MIHCFRPGFLYITRLYNNMDPKNGAQAVDTAGKEDTTNQSSYGDMAIGMHSESVKPGPRCDTCSEQEILGYKTQDIFHHHYSTKLVRDCSGTGEKNVYFCEPCKSVHPTVSNVQERLKICVTSAELHKYWETETVPFSGGLPFNGTQIHVDYLSIPGARLNELTAAWEIEYFDEPRPMDVILVAGIGNVMKGHEVDSIMRSFKHFIELVEWQGTRFHPNVKNTCGIATYVLPSITVLV